MRRLIRILVYEGTNSEIQSVLEMRGVKGSRRFNGDLLIRESILGDFLEEFDHYDMNDAQTPSEHILAQQAKYLWNRLGVANQSDAVAMIDGLLVLVDQPQSVEHREGQLKCPECKTLSRLHKPGCIYSGSDMEHHTTKE